MEEDMEGALGSVKATLALVEFVWTEMVGTWSPLALFTDSLPREAMSLCWALGRLQLGLGKMERVGEWETVESEPMFFYGNQLWQVCLVVWTRLWGFLPDGHCPSSSLLLMMMDMGEEVTRRD